MEKETVPLGEKMKYMVGLRFDRVKHMERGVRTGYGFYVFLGFYWFCFCLFKRWPLPFSESYVTGLSFAYKPNPTASYGDLMWLHDKRCFYHDYPGGPFNA